MPVSGSRHPVCLAWRLGNSRAVSFFGRLVRRFHRETKEVGSIDHPSPAWNRYSRRTEDASEANARAEGEIAMRNDAAIDNPARDGRMHVPGGFR